MARSFKSKIVMFVLIVFFMIFYMLVFGSKNMTVGFTIALIALMNLGNDLSFKPKTSFIKVLGLLLILGIASYLNNPLTIWGCILTFFVAFGTTFTSYNLFGSMVYLPYLMCYFMMVGNPISIDLMPMRFLSLFFGAIFIVSYNIIINRKKNYKYSKASIDTLINELNKAIDLKLEGKEVSLDNFKESNGFYKIIFNRFEYKFFPTKTHESVLNKVKSCQYIGRIVSKYDFTEDELKYTKKVLANIREISPDEIFEGIEIKTREMSLILLNLEVLANEFKKDLSNDKKFVDRKTIKRIMEILFGREFTFKSPKFTFAFKMALILFIWQLLTLIFNLPYTKWLYFITLPLMMPYVDNLAYVTKARIKGTFFGVFIFAIIFVLIPYISISLGTLLMSILFICMFVLVMKMEDKFILATASTVISVMSSLMYINLPQAFMLKILWVVVGASVVSLFNFKFMPYSVEIESKNGLKACCKFNKRFIGLIKEKCMDGDLENKKTSLLVVINMIHGNIQVTEENKEVYDLQIRITDISNFILNYLDIYPPSDILKENLISIIDKDIDDSDNLNIKDRVISYSLTYVKKFYNEELAIMRDLK